MTLFFHESLKMPDFLSLITTNQVFKKICFSMNISLTAFYNRSLNWLPFRWLLVHIVLYFLLAGVLRHFSTPDRAESNYLIRE